MITSNKNKNRPPKNINYKKLENSIRELGRQTDQALSRAEKICKKGCSHCCHQSISIHAPEELVISSFVNKKMNIETKDRVKKNLENWLDEFDMVTPEVMEGDSLKIEDVYKAEKLLALKRVPCPFLISDECSIYEARPIICRTHFVNDDVSLCEADTNRSGDQKGDEIYKHKVMKIMNMAPTWIRLLPYAMTDMFEVRRKVKPFPTRAHVAKSRK